MSEKQKLERDYQQRRAEDRKEIKEVTTELVKTAFKEMPPNEKLHLALDITGCFIDPVDGINALLYLAEGRYGEAALSSASLIPIGGIFVAGGKLLGKTLKWGDNAVGAVKTAEKIGDGVSAAQDAYTYMQKSRVGMNILQSITPLMDELTESVTKYGNEFVETVVEKGTKEVAEEAVEKGTKEIVEEVVEKGTKEAAEEVAENGVKKAIGAIAEKAGDAAPAAKNLPEAVEEFGETVKKLDKAGVDEVVEGGGDVLNNLKPQNLMDELASSGVKYNPDEVIAVMKTADGNLLWLEQGNVKSGLTHILEGHAEDFASQGVDNIQQLLNDVLKNAPIKTGSNSKGLFADYVFNGNTYRVAYGTNGYIVSFYPID